MIKNLLERYYRFSYRVETLPSPLVFTLGLILAIVISPLILLNWGVENLMLKFGVKGTSRIPRGWVSLFYLLWLSTGILEDWSIVATLIVSAIVEYLLEPKTQVD